MPTTFAITECQKDLIAGSIARRITTNCELYESKLIPREMWHETQMQLWKEASESVVAADVMRILFPPMGA